MSSTENAEPEENRSPKKSNRLFLLWDLMQGHRRLYSWAIISLIVASCLMYMVPLIPQAVIDGILSGDSKNSTTLTRFVIDLLGGSTVLGSNIWIAALAMTFLTGLSGIFTYLRGRYSATASEGIVQTVRDRLYDHLQHLPCSYYDQQETGDLIQRCTSDVDTLREFLATQVVEVGRASLMILIPLPLMLYMNIPMTLISIIVVPPILIFSFIFFRKIKKVFKASDEAEGKMTTQIQENLTGIRVVRAFARQDHEIERFGEKNRKHRDLNCRMYTVFAWFWALSDLLCMAQKALVVGVGGYWLFTGSLKPGDFVYFLLVVNMFLWPIRNLGRILADLGKASVAIERILEILDSPREDIKDATSVDTRSKTSNALKLTKSTTAAGHLKCSNVSFAHTPRPKADKEKTADKDDEDAQPTKEGKESKRESRIPPLEKIPVLRDISFEIAAGETLALLGPSGSGKSTIVNLLLRLYDFESGTIELDGIDLTSLPRSVVRSRMAAVLQEPFLYSKSLRDNLKLGKPGADQNDIRKATIEAGVHHSIEAFSEGYDTLVGERGIMLSGGQRQRVTLARALLNEPDILILDDALSAVDTETETQILKALRKRHGKHTTILIAHRLSTIAHADRIILLEEGQIIQEGTHEELIQVAGRYQNLWNLQSSAKDKLNQEITKEENVSAT